MDTHVMRMVRSWWNTWGAGRADQAALVALADGIHRMIREAETEARREAATALAFDSVEHATQEEQALVNRQ